MYANVNGHHHDDAYSHQLDGYHHNGHASHHHQQQHNHSSHHRSRSRGVSADRHHEHMTPQYYEDAYYRSNRETETPSRRVIVKHILTTEPSQQRAVSSMEHGSRPAARMLPSLPGGSKPLERHLSHPNLRDRPGHGRPKRQLPKTPSQPAATIILIENKLPEQRFYPPRRSDSNLAFVPPSASSLRHQPRRPQTAFGHHGSLSHVRHERHEHSRDHSSHSHVGGGHGHRQPHRRAYSLPRRRSLSQHRHRALLPQVPVGSGRRLPPTPHQSALVLHHAPVSQQQQELQDLQEQQQLPQQQQQLPQQQLVQQQLPQQQPQQQHQLLQQQLPPASSSSAPKRQLPVPQTLSLRNTHRDLFLRSRSQLSRMSSRSMNFPHLERSPSRCCSSGTLGGSSLDDGLDAFDAIMPLPSVPAGLRTAMYRNRRKLLE